VMGLVMGFASQYYSTNSLGPFASLQMYYPALGVIIAMLLNKNIRQGVPKYFYGGYIFFTITSIIYLLISIALKKEPVFFSYWIMLCSITLVMMYSRDGSDKMDTFGLKFTNGSKSFLYVILFFILYISVFFIMSLFFGNAIDVIAPFKDIITWRGLFNLPYSFLLSFSLFIGEEYGWRYFLQPALQERLGKRKGIIVLGLIWGIWHLPLNMFYYSPSTSFYSVLNQLIVCVNYSIFFGFVYMKTKNIWSVTIIHFLNNSLGWILYGATGTDLVYTFDSVIMNLIFLSLVYMPFLFAKVYRSNKEDVDEKGIIDL